MEEYEQTLHDKEYTGRTISLQELELKISEINDVPGDAGIISSGKTTVETSKVVYYLARADKILDTESTRLRVLRDIKKTPLLDGSKTAKTSMYSS